MDTKPIDATEENIRSHLALYGTAFVITVAGKRRLIHPDNVEVYMKDEDA